MIKYYLIADIGGTNSRFAISKIKDNNFKILKLKIYNTSNFNSLFDLTKNYLELIKNKYKLECAVFAIAGQVNNKPHLTNSNLDINIRQTQILLKLRKIHIINDFLSSAYSIEKLKSSDLKVIQKGCKNTTKTKTIIGAGTGLGKAACFYDDKSQTSTIIPSEGGHEDFPFINNSELKLIEFLKKKYKKQTIEEEDLVSGKGIEGIYEYLSNIKKSAKEISKIKNRNLHAKKTFELFYLFYARIAKNFAITQLSEGGVYLAGGIITKNLSFSKKKFIKEFTNNQTYSLILKEIPIYIIKNDKINLIGASNYIIRNKL